MSLASWKAEFLRTPAENAAEGTVGEVLLHSLNKWHGLTTEDLTEHQLSKSDGSSKLSDLKIGGIEWIADDTCSLCYAAKRATYPLVGPAMSIDELGLNGFGDQHCKNCLLAHYGEKKGCIPEYRTFIDGSDPRPMIYLLSKALAGAIEAGHCDIPAKDAV